MKDTRQRLAIFQRLQVVPGTSCLHRYTACLGSKLNAVMRLVQFFSAGRRCVGSLVSKDGVEYVRTLYLQDGSAPESLKDLLHGKGAGLLETAEVSASDEGIPLSKVKLAPPITGMDKVICVGMNYKDHCEEQGVPVPLEPIIFNKFPSCVVAHEDAIPYPEVTDSFDWEVELVIVMKREGKNIPRNEASDYILGYSVSNDLSARDWQLHKNGGQWLLGKAMEGFCPLGPCIVTPDELGDPHNLKIQCRVNGVTKQDSRTSQIVHKCEDIIAFVSKFFTLLPGDIILTGTPPGVGVFRKPPEALKKGDVVECEVEGIGILRNHIV